MNEIIDFLSLDKDIKNYIINNFMIEDYQIKNYVRHYISIGRNKYCKLIITLKYIPTKTKKGKDSCMDLKFESFTQEEFRKRFIKKITIDYKTIPFIFMIYYQHFSKNETDKNIIDDFKNLFNNQLSTEEITQILKENKENHVL